MRGRQESNEFVGRAIFQGYKWETNSKGCYNCDRQKSISSENCREHHQTSESFTIEIIINLSPLNPLS